MCHCQLWNTDFHANNLGLLSHAFRSPHFAIVRMRIVENANG